MPQRDRIKSRNPDQNTVMGESAKDAYEHFFHKMADALDPDMKKRLSRAFHADFHGTLFENNHRPEWLHLYGWSLAPMGTDPQTQANLGAGPKWANTQMMLLERVVKWFAVNSPKSISLIKPKFDMLLDSDLIEHIDFEVKIQLKGKYVELMQKIDPYLEYPLFPKSSDLAQTAGITYDLLHDIAPLSRVEVQQPKKPATRQQTARPQAPVELPLTTASTATTRPSLKATSTPVAAVAEPIEGNRKHAHEDDDEGDLDFQVKRRAISQPVATAQNKSVQIVSPAHDVLTKSGLTVKQYKELVDTVKADLKRKRQHSSSDDEAGSDFKAKRSSNAQLFPPPREFRKSVVQVCTTGFEPNYDMPWVAPDEKSWSGSGVVIAIAGENYVLTNAHVAQNASFMQVRLANTSEHYEAQAKVVAYQCDLALLKVEDHEFNERVRPVELGDMVGMEQDVMTVGFPMGGNELSISTGIVSRIEVGEYSMSGQSLLQVQIDAAVNHGNSGGPVFSGNKVVGIAFQGYDLQGLGFMIPMPIVRRFLAEVFSGHKYRGFPIIAFETEGLENPSKRQYYQMEKRTGLRITKIDYLCDAYNKLKVDDILLSIDGMDISNDGTVNIEGIGERIDMRHVTQVKMLGETVKLQILRKKAQTQQSEILDIEVVLDTICGDTEKVSVTQYDRMPTYFYHSGICFAPLTRNDLEVGCSDLDNAILLEEGCSLPDAPKRNPGDEVIVIKNILASKKTHGYDEHIHDIVKEINGVPINNMRDVIRAMEENKDRMQVITLMGNGKSKIIVEKMTRNELQGLFKRHKMFDVPDRSKDLIDDVVAVESLQATVAEGMDTSADARVASASAPVVSASTIELAQSTQTSSRPDSVELALSKRHGSIKRTRFVLESSSSEDEESQEDCFDNKPLTADMLPGLKRYHATLDAMEKHYSALPSADDEDEDEDEDEDDDYEDDEEISLDESDEDDNDTEVEEDVQQEDRVVPTLHRHNAKSAFGFFKSSQQNESEDDAPVSERKHGGSQSRR